MRDFLVYLAGPITGESYGGCTDWRKYAQEHLNDNVSGVPIYGVSPMRAKEYLASECAIGASYENTALSSAKGIMTRDRMDVMRSDLVLVNLLGAMRVSIGTVMEIAWADAFRKPVVLVIEPGNLHHHGMIEQACGFIVPTLDEGISTAIAVLSPRG